MDAQYTGKQIAERRKALGLTQKALAARLSVTDKAVSKWERGLNFPDLGLMEELAEALNTSSAELLGLNNTTQEEAVSSMAQLSAQQQEDAHRDIRLIGWISLVAAVLLVIAYDLFGSKTVREIQTAYQILQAVITAVIIGGIWLLFKYGEIRKWELGDWLVFYGAALPVLIWNGIYFITGYSPNDYLSMVCVVVCAAMTQLLFCRVIRPKLIQALPALLTIGYVVWRLFGGYSPTDALLAAAGCAAVWLLRHFQNKRWQAKTAP